MLSSYETGRQRPSLETLEKVLSTLGCDLHDLHNSLQIVNGRPQILRRRFEEGVEEADGVDGNAEGTSATGAPPAGRMDVQKILGLTQPLPAEEEKAVAQILDGFHRLIRYLHRTARPTSSVTPTAPPLPSSPEGRDERGGRGGNDDSDED
jgi:transcriptional regulator with XRE-family HTH domain